MTKRNRVVMTACVLATIVWSAPVARAQSAATDAAESDELVGTLTKELGVTQDQARRGAGTLFALAKQRLEPSAFADVAKAVPGMDGLLAAAPALDGLGGDRGRLGTLAATAGAFKTLGLQPGMVTKFVPVLTKFVGAKGGGGVAQLLAGALK